MRLFLACVLLLAVATACGGPDIYEGDIIEGGDDVVVEVHSWVEEVDVEDVVGRKEQGRTSGQFIVENESSDHLRLRVYAEWMDEDGIRLRYAAGEQPVTYLVLRPGETRTLTFLSPTEKAVRMFAHVNTLASEDA